ncbi:glycosyltransferase family 2 protein [Patescibacteria group bacterium]|nr:glycosyltransferase family 2 protein [Patescibacteria group bacterium]
MQKPRISLVIAVYNEEESLRPLVDAIEPALRSGPGFEYVWVDDGSTDGSFEELIRLKKRAKSRFRIIRMRKNTGKSTALAAGFQVAGGDIIATMDADLQDDPAEIPKMIALLEKGYDLIVGWRVNRQDPKKKILLSRIFNAVVRRVGGVGLHDMNCGLKVMRREVAEEIQLYGELHRFIPVLSAAKGFRVTEMPVVHHARKYSTSKFGSGRIVHAFFDLFTTAFIIAFKNRPLQLFGRIGMICILLGTFVLLYLSGLHFLGQSIGRRPLLFLGILLILFGIQLFSTGLLGELVTSRNIRREQHPIREIIE